MLLSLVLLLLLVLVVVVVVVTAAFRFGGCECGRSQIEQHK